MLSVSVACPCTRLKRSVQGVVPELDNTTGATSMLIVTWHQAQLFNPKTRISKTYLLRHWHWQVGHRVQNPRIHMT